MPAVSQDVDGSSEDWSVERAISLLEQALEIIDRWPSGLAIGARLQQVIEDVQDLAPSEEA